jgi:hypothetical protein
MTEDEADIFLWGGNFDEAQDRELERRIIMTAEQRKGMAASLVRQLIDVGAACQKAGSFSVCDKNTPLRSVYDVYAEKVDVVLVDIINGEHT